MVGRQAVGLINREVDGGGEKRVVAAAGLSGRREKAMGKRWQWGGEQWQCGGKWWA